MATWRVKYGGTAGDNWQVQKSGRFIREKDSKQGAVNLARARANQGDTMVVERRNGSVQKDVTITSSNEDRLDMNEGTWSLF